MVVATGQQCGPRRGTEGCGVKVVVLETIPGHTVEVRRGDWAAEGARGAEAGVVGHDEQDVGGALGRRDTRGKVRLGFAGLAPDDAAEWRVRYWKDRRTSGRRFVSRLILGVETCRKPGRGCQPA